MIGDLTVVRFNPSPEYSAGWAISEEVEPSDAARAEGCASAGKLISPIYRTKTAAEVALRKILEWQA